MASRYRSYVALGDSFTEGLSDPDGHGGYRGFAANRPMLTPFEGIR